MHPLFQGNPDSSSSIASITSSRASSSSSLMSLEGSFAPCLTSLPHVGSLSHSPSPPKLQPRHRQPQPSSPSRTSFRAAVSGQQGFGAVRSGQQSFEATQKQPEGTEPEEQGEAEAPQVAGVFPDMGQALAATRQLLGFLGDQSSQVSVAGMRQDAGMKMGQGGNP